MNRRQYLAIIDRIRDLTSDVRELTLRLLDPPELVFSPGQSLSFEIPSAKGEGSVIRYYSLASPPSQPRKLVLLLRATDDGTGSPYLFGKKEGEEIRFRGPDGSFCLHEDPHRDILFIATGTGIAPFRSMLHTLFEKPVKRNVTLFWGLRSEQDVYYDHELDALANHHSNFSSVIVLSRAERSWPGAKGRVTQLVEKITSVETLAVYICGNKSMVAEVTAILRRKGDCPIYRERFYHEIAP